MGEIKKKILTRICAAIISLIPFAILYVLTKTVFKGVYVFEWAMENSYIYLWIVIPVITLFDIKWGTVLSVANIVCIIFGQVYGQYKHDRNVALITPDMTVEQVYHLKEYSGVFDWIYSLLLIAVVYGIYRIVRYNIKKYKKKKADASV